MQLPLALLGVDEHALVLLVTLLLLLLVVGPLSPHLLRVVLLDVLLQVLIHLAFALLTLVEFLFCLPPRLRIEVEVFPVGTVLLVVVEFLRGGRNTSMGW
jgi:hypothetical protein